MSRTANVPDELKRSPFTLEEARVAGLTLSALKGRNWRRLGSQLYCWSHWPEDKWALLSAWQRILPRDAVFSGRTAASIHGLDFEPSDPVEVTLPTDSSVRTSFGLKVRHCDLSQEDIVAVNKLRVTPVLRTLRDLCVQWPPAEALVAFDAALKSRLTDVVTLCRYAGISSGLPAAARMRELAKMAEPAESPMETRLRFLFAEAGIERPQVQVDLHDAAGQFVGRADMYFPRARLVVEFDGGNHRERQVSDDRRQNLLINAGFTVLRFTTLDLRGRPDVVIAQVRAALTKNSDSARLVQNVPNWGSRSARLAPNGRNGLLRG